MAIPLGLDFQSSTAQASPLYNQNAGIFFGNAGDANANGDVSPSAISQKTPSRQTLGGTNAYPDSTIGGNFLSADGGIPVWLYIVGGLVVLAGGIFAIKKL